MAGWCKVGLRGRLAYQARVVGSLAAIRRAAVPPNVGPSGPKRQGRRSAGRGTALADEWGDCHIVRLMTVSQPDGSADSSHVSRHPHNPDQPHRTLNPLGVRAGTRAWAYGEQA